jgi:predicted O-methyltransferase YrrM
MGPILKIPASAWPTKGFEFWTFLSLLLLYAKPRSILELGSGRSTSILADYANTYNRIFTSLETDEAWYNKATLDLVCLGIRRKQVHLIRFGESGRWYDIEQFKKLTDTPVPFDFVFVDAPNTGKGKSIGYRDFPEGLTEIKARARQCQTMIVDDIHRNHVFETIDKMLSAPDDYEKYYYDYPVLPKYPNSLCICVHKSSSGAMSMGDIQKAVGMKLYRDFTSASCKEP